MTLSLKYNNYGTKRTGSSAWRSGSERRFSDFCHRKVDGLISTQASLLRP